MYMFSDFSHIVYKISIVLHAYNINYYILTNSKFIYSKKC